MIKFHDRNPLPLQEKYNDSLTFYRQAVELRTKVLGPEHSDTIASVRGEFLVHRLRYSHPSRAFGVHLQVFHVSS